VCVVAERRAVEEGDRPAGHCEGRLRRAGGQARRPKAGLGRQDAVLGQAWSRAGQTISATEEGSEARIGLSEDLASCERRPKYCYCSYADIHE
jgi:hypothetical protein